MLTFLKKYWRLILAIGGAIVAFILGRRTRHDNGRDSGRADEHYRDARDALERGRATADGAADDAKYIEAKTERIVGIIHAAKSGNDRAKELLEELRRRAEEDAVSSDGAVDDIGD